MNQLVLALFALVSVALALPVEQQEPQVRILKQSSIEPGPDGSYAYAFEAENGINVDEQGSPDENEHGEFVKTVAGSYSYTAPDGTPIHLTYTADVDGFHPTGEHLPVAPPVPEGIQRSLEWNAAHPEEDTVEKTH